MDELELAAAALAVDEQPSEGLPALASHALERGVDSPALRVAAAATNDVRLARDRFLAALDELGIDRPDMQVALWKLVHHKAGQIVDGRIQPYDGARWIWKHAHHRVEREGDLRIFIGLASDWEDHANRRSEIDGEIVRAARTLIAQTDLRRWVRLEAKAGCWPLWEPYARRSFRETELPLTEGLRSELRQWAADFDANSDANHAGPSGFASEGDAERYVERGRFFVVRIQDELGDDWHVEYMPTQVRFPPSRCR